MVFQFNDKSLVIKHLCFIIEAKKIDAKTLKIKESIAKNSINEDLLFYSKETTLNKDIKRLKQSLEEYTRFVNDMQKEQRIGFQTEEAAGQIEEPEEEGGTCDE